MDKLSKAFIEAATIGNIELPAKPYFSLPERVLQFGTGVLLRGLPDYFIDRANKQGIFNGRVVVVKSTPANDSGAFEAQDGLFTHYICGLYNGVQVERRLVNAAVSRVINASGNWEAILAVAENPGLDIVISNTTEIGITLVRESIFNSPPSSFPAKLLAVLYHRYVFFKGEESKGMVIVPTELVPGNGRLLQSVCRELAVFNQLDEGFMKWLDGCNYFCSSLVDRIVPGKPGKKHLAMFDGSNTYTDELAILSEPYALWAIEAQHPEVRKRLSFAAANPEVVLAGDIGKYLQLKLHLLNGTHTFGCGLALLCGFSTVKESLDHRFFSSYINRLLEDEMIPALVNEQISGEEAGRFAAGVMERFRNPSIDHFWQSITLNYSAKMKMRNLPLLLNYVERNGAVPPLMALGFAAMFVYFHHNVVKDGKLYFSYGGYEHEIADDRAGLFQSGIEPGNYLATAQNLLGLSMVWGMDLNELEGFAYLVAGYLEQLMQRPPLLVLEDTLRTYKPELV